ncbi:MAG TPA: type II toxin-antitoxin system HicA family toxin [candidate division Zixibacteria bacterium]|nr:type II toxin-antitoxin system HicA family toxin [candidate division Zixibacteria bacterium]
MRLPKYKPVSGRKTINILCNKFGFSISGQKGSHVRLSKITPNGKIGTVIPLHKELKFGTLKGALKLAKVDLDDFYKYV